MGLFDGIRRWLSGEPKEEEVEISEPVTPKIGPIIFPGSPVTEAVMRERQMPQMAEANQASQPVTLGKREEWRQRKGLCPGSRTKAEYIRYILQRRFGQCPICKRGGLGVTSKGTTWPHKGEA